MQDKSNLFEAGNIYLAAYLVYRGFSIRGLTGYGRQKRLQFDNSPEIQSASKEFFAGSEESRLFDSYRKTKDYLFQNGV
ncbi:MAG: hypothetical protein PHV82_16260 [Victivallaceae bacterium]|nr:hypothetical protein [Victivallaceae bacterium]